jgi:hypothetical protein
MDEMIQNRFEAVSYFQNRHQLFGLASFWPGGKLTACPSVPLSLGHRPVPV